MYKNNFIFINNLKKNYYLQYKYMKHNKQNIKNYNLSLLVFGTNQCYEPPYDLILSFLNNKNATIIENKQTKEITFEYSLDKGEPVKIKSIFVKEIAEKKPYYDKVDAYVIFADLEMVDTLDKLNEIVQFLLECNSNIPSFIFGKYNNNTDKIQSLSSETMNKQLKKHSDLIFNYDEICTEQTKIFNDIIEINLKKCWDNKRQKKNNSKIKEYDQAKSGCFIF